MLVEKKQSFMLLGFGFFIAAALPFLLQASRVAGDARDARPVVPVSAVLGAH